MVVRELSKLIARVRFPYPAPRKTNLNPKGFFFVNQQTTLYNIKKLIVNRAMKNIFLIAGRTGGPLMPVLAIAKNLNGYNPIIIGVRDGYEEKVVSKKKQIPIQFLPEVKLNLLSFKNTSIVQFLLGLLETFGSSLIFIFSLIKSAFYLFKYKPKAIISAGSFLAVPVIWASKITNLLKITNTRIIIHQQDPTPGLANKLTIKSADIKTCTFEYTRDNFPKFEDCQVIPNPIDIEAYSQKNFLEIAENISKTNPKLFDFFQRLNNKKSLFFIFGGGSGSETINDWVDSNLARILRDYNVIHLTGELQDKTYNLESEWNYLNLSSLGQEMPMVMKASDLVLCRAGLSSIGELLYLNKPAFLVPMTNSHQEKNAEQVREYFGILHQKDQTRWLKEINLSYPQDFKNINYPGPKKIEEKLNKYYDQIKSLLDKSSVISNHSQDQKDKDDLFDIEI